MNAIPHIEPVVITFDVMVVLGMGGPHHELVDELRRSVRRRTRVRAWLRHATAWS